MMAKLMFKDKVPDDIAIISASQDVADGLLYAVQRLALLNSRKPKNILQELKEYRKYTPKLIEAYLTMSNGLNKAAMQVKRIDGISYERGGKRWSDEEDEQLIELVCEEKENIHSLSTIFGRSPGAIQTHISELVGRKRLSQSVAGKFIGKINGVQKEAEIEGTIYR